MSYELDAIAAAVIGGSSNGRSGRITGTLIGAMILGLIKSGFTFVGVDAYVQDIIKGIIIVAAVTIDMRRNRKNTNLINERQRRRMPLPPVLSRNKQILRRAPPVCFARAAHPVQFRHFRCPFVRATRGLRFLESYEYTILWQILAALASGKRALSSRCSRGWRSGARSGHEFAGQRGLP